jgi:hypothetical protein
MAKLIPCKTCKKEVSSNAKSCPNCGEINPTFYPQSFKEGLVEVRENIGIIIGIIFLFLFVFAFFTRDNGTKNERLEDQQAATYEIKCSKNYKLCKNNKDVMNLNRDVAILGGVKCKRAAEEKAVSEIDWGGFLSLNFSYFEDGNSAIKEDKILLIDKVAMHGNEFGGKIKKKTFCVYDIKTKEVEDVQFD